jgi:hypothetical protein
MTKTKEMLINLSELTANNKYKCFANTEAEFLDEIQTKVLRVFLLAIHSLSTNGFYSPSPHPP